MYSAVALNPTLHHSYEHRAHVRAYAGVHPEARADAEAAITGTDSSLGLTARAVAAARAGDTVLARRLVARALVGDRPIHHEGRIWLISAVIALGDAAQALDLLAAERDRLGLVYLRHLTRMPDFDPIRSHPRFERIIAAAERTP